MIRIMNVKFNGLQKVMSRLALLLIAVVMFGCKDDLADPPVIKVYVNGAEYDATERLLWLPEIGSAIVSRSSPIRESLP